MTDRPPLPYDWAEVRAKLQDDLPRLLDRLALRDELTRKPNGDGQRIYPRSPLRADKRPGSFVVWITGDAKGAWKDYAVPHHKGDVFDLVQAIERLQAKIDVYWWALDFLGLDRGGDASQPRTKAAALQDRERREAERAAAEARAQADDAAKSRGLFNRWLALPQWPGSIVETYLVGARRLPMDRLKKPPGAIRYAAEWEHIDGETGEVKTWRHLMVSAMTRGELVTALHFTFLKPDGGGKAWSPGKLMVGPARGAAIRLTAGPTGLTPGKAGKAGRIGPLAISEGIETGLTVAVARPDYRVWAAGSLSLMGCLDWPDCASAIVLLADNDDSPGAMAGLKAVQRHWQDQAKGRPVHVARSAVGSDFNDWAKAGAA